MRDSSTHFKRNPAPHDTGLHNEPLVLCVQSNVRCDGLLGVRRERELKSEGYLRFIPLLPQHRGDVRRDVVAGPLKRGT